MLSICLQVTHGLHIKQWAKAYAYLMDNDGEKKKAKGTKKCVIKLQLMFENYKGCLFNDKIISKSQRRFKSVYHNVYTEEINKIDLSSNGDKRLQTLDRVTTYSYRKNAIKMCESKIMIKNYADWPFYDEIRTKKFIQNK